MSETDDQALGVAKRADRRLLGALDSSIDTLRLFRALLLCSRDGIAVLDLASQRYLFVSTSQLAITGFEADAIMTVTWDQILGQVHPADRTRLAEMHSRLSSGELTSGDIEYRWQFSWGMYRTFHESRSVLHDSRGHPIALLSITRDVSDERKLESERREAHERLKLAQQAAGIGTFDYDLRTGALRWDDRMRAIWGYGPDDTINMERLRAGIHPEDRVLQEQAMQRALDPEGDRSCVAEYRLSTEAGATGTNERWVHATGKAIFEDGRPVRVVGTTVDISERKCAEQSRAESEARYRALFAQYPFALGLSLLDGTMVDCNEAFLSLFGFARAEVVGRNVEDLAIGEAHSHSQILAELSERGSIREIHCARRTKAGAELRVSISADVLTIGSCPHILTTIRDVTAEREREEALRLAHERLAAALDASPMVLMNQDLDLRYTWIHNPALGYRPEEVAQTFDHDLFERPEDAARLTAIKRRVLETQLPAREEVQIQHHGSMLWYDLSVRPRYEEGRLVGILATAHDISARKHSELALERADSRRREFLAVLAHELRNPLAPMLDSLRLLEAAESGSKTERKARDVLQRQATQLSRLVDDLGDITRIDRGKLPLARVLLDARACVRHCCDDQAHVFEQRGLRLNFESARGEPVWVSADPSRLQQMVGNLLSNALKFTPRGGRVDVRLAESSSTVEIRVRDNGKGVDSRELDRIFRPFTQSERTTEGGLGIGLALVRELAAQHGGSVWAKSAGLNQGTEVSIVLPRAEAPRSQQRHTGARSARPLRILLVDDNEDAADILASLLTLRGHVVHIATRGHEALACISELRAQVLLCDIGLPDMTGYEVLDAIRSMEDAPNVYAVALTGYALPEDIERARSCGFQAHLRKPAELEDLERVFEQAASCISQQDQA